MLEANIDPDFHAALKQFAAAATDTGVSWLVVGATARVLLLENVYGWPAGLGTQDTDFAVLVDSWESYRALCQRFAAEPDVEPLNRPPKRFRAKGGRYFDLLPYGGVEENDRQVFWPPHRDSLMTVRGFRGAAGSVLIVRVNGDLEVPVASPAGLCALKFFAWEERHAQQPGRDARDIAYLFDNIERLVPHEFLYEHHAEIAEAFDYQLAPAATTVFGIQVAALLEADEREFLMTFLEQELNQDADAPLIRELQRYMRVPDASNVAGLLNAFRQGLARGTR